METIIIGTSILAIILSSTAIVLSLLNYYSSKRMADTTAYLARYQNVETNLANWSDAFKFYGIDINQAKENDVTPEMITYLVLYINTINSKIRFDGTNLEIEFLENSLLRRMFSYDATIATWKYTKNAFGDDVVNEIDLIISKSKQSLTKSCS